MGSNYLKEFSKKVLYWTMLIFVGTVVVACVFAWNGKDTSIFMYSIPTSGGIFGASIAFYLNKAKIENVCKGKIQFFKFKMKYLEKHPQRAEEIESELSSIDSALNSKIDSTIDESISEEITIQS